MVVQNAIYPGIASTRRFWSAAAAIASRPTARARSLKNSERSALSAKSWWNTKQAEDAERAGGLAQPPAEQQRDARAHFSTMTAGSRNVGTPNAAM